MIQLVAIDLDDTLLDSRLQVSQECRRALQEVRARNIKITLATGRMFQSARRYALELDMEIPLITYQGALVKNAVSNEVIHHRTVPRDLALRVANMVRECGYHYQAYFDDKLYMERLTPEGQAYAALAGVQPVIAPALPELLVEQESTKMIIINDNVSALLELEAYMNDHFSDQLYITRSKPNFLEVMHRKATKGQALQTVSEYFGIDQRSVMAIGDSFNDIDMVEWAGVGVAMANSHPEVQAVADYVTLSNDEDGVAEALRNLVLRGYRS